MSVSRRSTTSVKGLTLFSSEGILCRGGELADGDKERSLIGICRSDPSHPNPQKMSFGRSSAVYIHQQALSSTPNHA